MNLVLRDLTEHDEQAFLAGLSYWDKDSLDWYSFIWNDNMTYDKMLSILRSDALGLNLAPDRVPHNMLYGFLDGKIIGRVSVRHRLNERLEKRGGHIGYAVAEPFRKKGYASEMVRQALEFCKTLGLKDILVTCSDDNVPSWKIIEKFNGRLDSTVWDDEDQEMIRKYWIKLD